MSNTTIQDQVTQTELTAFVNQATCEVFSTMLGQEVTALEPFIERTATSPSSGIVSLVGLAGAWVGTGGMSCSAALGCRLASLFLLTEYDSVSEDVLDALAELTNMIIGNVKTLLEESLGPLGLSVPTVIFGSNFQTRNAGSHSWVVVPFECDGEKLHVQLCLTPNHDREHRADRPGYPIPHLLNA